MPLEPEDLPMESRTALRLAALLGETVALPALIKAGVEAGHLDPLFDLGLLVEEGVTEASFVDDELRQSVLENTPWSQKRRASLALADALERLGGDCALMGRLYLQAQRYEKARVYLVRAAEKMCLDNEYAKALELLKKAFEVWPPHEESERRIRVLKEMARCAANTGENDVARVAWEELLDVADLDGNARLQIEANRSLADLAGKRGDRLEVKQRLKRAAELCAEFLDTKEQAQQWRVYAQFLLDTVRLKEAIGACERSIEAAEAAGDWGTVSEVLALSALAHAMVGKGEEGQGLVERSIGIAIERELPDKLAIAYRRKANVREYSCDYEGYLDLELDSLDRCRSRGDGQTEQACVSCLSYAFFRLGQWKQSSDMLRAVIDEMKIGGELLAIATAVRASVAALRGERKQAASKAKEGLDLIRRHGAVALEFYIHWSKGFLAMLDGDRKLASEAFGDLIALWRETDDRKDCVPGLLTATMFYTDLGDEASQSECIDILNLIASENHRLETTAARDSALAERAWLRGKIEEAIPLCQSALAGYEAQGLPPEIAIVARRLGVMHASKGDLEAAEAAWSLSASVARSLGMRPLLDALEADRRSAGLCSSVDQAESLAVLTKRQRDVLRLIASGSTNKEAAEALGLSPRTVEMHVACALERLNCRGRAEAVKKASELGLV